MSIDFRVDGQVAVVTLDRPQAMNAIDAGIRSGLRDAFRHIADDDAIRVAVLTGAGERAFCAGNDLKATATVDGPFAAEAFGGTAAAPIVAHLVIDKPVIAAVNGVAMGGGLEIALACDILLASRTARFALTEVRIGSLPGAGGTQRLPRAIPRSTAMLMLLAGEAIDADEAHRLGLVSRVLEPAELLPQALALAARIAANAPLAVRAIKRLVNLSSEPPLQAGLQAERFAFGLLRDTADRAEGRRAFAEKRPPVFTGR